jgi:hypothetical protein
MRRRLPAVAAVAALLLAGCAPPMPDHIDPGRSNPTHSMARSVAPPPPPDMSSYQQVSVADYLVPDQGAPSVYFQTPDGLSCKIGRVVGCDGALQGTPAPANEVELYAHSTAPVKAEPDGFRQTSRPAYIRPGGGPPKVLPPGHKIVYRGFQCAVSAGAITMCSSGTPPGTWLVLSPQLSGIGPRTAGLPPRFPDPHDYVIDEGPYPSRPEFKNMFPVFTVESGLVCEIRVFSGGVVRCDGPLPDAPEGENEIFIDLSNRQEGMRRTDPPARPAYLPKNIREMPVQHRLDYTYETYTTCMAPSDGGVACYSQGPDHVRGFVVSADSAWTFGG